MDVAADVGRIVEAAERAAEELRTQAEERARARIAEADRASENRVQAAEAEAVELLANAHTEAERLTGAAAKVRQEAEEERTRLYAEALDSANQEATTIREKATGEARAMLSEARSAAGDVLADGTQLSSDLRDLSSSLRANAERLLRDIQRAHSTMLERIDTAAPGGRSIESDPRPRGGRTTPGGEVDVPEFLPGER